MDFATIGVWIALLLIGLGVVAIVAFGLKSVASGKFRISTLAGALIPIVVFGISLALSAGAEHTLAQAAVLTGLLLLIGALLAVAATGLRSFI
jgi:hypothetical protein